MCTHDPVCPSAYATDHAAARVLVHQDDLGWSLLCNGVLLFNDTGEILPDGTTVAPVRHIARSRRRVTHTQRVAA